MLSLLQSFPDFLDIVPHIHLEINIHNDYEYGRDVYKRQVVSIKMTLYRLADKSQIVDALVEAAEVFAALLKGEVVEKSNLLLVAPKCLQNRVLDMIQEEIDQVKQGRCV